MIVGVLLEGVSIHLKACLSDVGVAQKNYSPVVCFAAWFDVAWLFVQFEQKFDFWYLICLFPPFNSSYTLTVVCIAFLIIDLLFPSTYFFKFCDNIHQENSEESI